MAGVFQPGVFQASAFQTGVAPPVPVGRTIQDFGGFDIHSPALPQRRKVEEPEVDVRALAAAELAEIQRLAAERAAEQRLRAAPMVAAMMRGAEIQAARYLAERRELEEISEIFEIDHIVNLLDELEEIEA